MPPFGVGKENDFGVARASEKVPSRTKIARNLAVVVDLSVVREPEPAIFARHRLVTRRRKVEDRQAAVTEDDGRVDQEPCIVRAAVRECVGHLRDKVLCRGRQWLEIESSGYPTHKRLT